MKKDYFKLFTIIYSFVLFFVIIFAWNYIWKKLEVYQAEYSHGFVTDGIYITCDNEMKVESKVSNISPEILSSSSDAIFEAFTNLTGKAYYKVKYRVDAATLSEIKVTNSNKREIYSIDTDYTNDLYFHNEDLENLAIEYFEAYLTHVNKLITFKEFATYVRRSSPVYKSVDNYQKSLYFKTGNRTIRFFNQRVDDLHMLDNKHFECKIYMDVDRLSNDMVRLKESMHFRALFENYKNKWYLYSFEVLAE